MRLLRPYADLDRDEFQSLPQQREWWVSPADAITWGCLIGGFATAALIVSIVLKVWR